MDIPANTWVDLYAATGITVAVQLIIQNVGANSVRLTESVAEPVLADGYNLIKPAEFLNNAVVSIGAWAFSSSGGILQVEEQ